MPQTGPNTPTSLVGDTDVRSWDKGVLDKLSDRYVVDDHYYARVDGVTYPSWPDDFPESEKRRKQMPGVPIIFANPNDASEYWVNPSIILRRMDPVPAMERWDAQTRKYVVPASDAEQVTVNGPKGIRGGVPYSETKTGYTKYREQSYPWAFDFMYTVLVRAEGEEAERESQRLFRWMLRRFPPRCSVDVTDSLGITNGYQVYVDGPTNLNEAIDIAHRVRGWAWTLRVLAYLDADDPYVKHAVTVPPTATTSNQFPEE